MSVQAKYRRKALYGMSDEHYQAMGERQRWRCAICRKRESAKGRSGAVKPLSVDHDHLTGAIRGLLCARCNMMLGYSRDNPATLRRAALYVEFGISPEHAL